MNTVHVTDRRQWHSWFDKNHDKRKHVWLVFYKGHTGKPRLSYEDAIEEALMFGWIDGMVRRIDDQKYALRFTPRRSGSIWSKLNIARVNKLISEGKMTRSGIEAFEKRTGEVSLAEKFKVHEPPMPDDFIIALSRNRKASGNFRKFTPSYKRRYLIWLTSAKRPATRKKRVEEAVDLIAQNVKNLLK